MEGIKYERIKNIIVLIILILCLLNVNSIAYNNIASAFGSTEINGNREKEINTAKNTYNNLGYSTNARIDPSPIIFLSNMMGRIMYVTCHGALRSFQFPECGLIMDNTAFPNSKEYYKTSSINWENGLLFTLACCNSAGSGGEYDLNSIAADIGYKGVEMTVGFTTEINSYFIVDWSENYHEKLAENYTVTEAVNYANSCFYINPNVKNSVVFYRENVTPISSSLNEREINKNSDNEMKKRNILENDNNTYMLNNDYTIDDIISSKIENFNKENYGIKTAKSVEVNITSKKVTDEKDYTEYVFKVGDFFTNYGYTIVSSNNKVEAIYDNNLDYKLQTKLLAKKENFIKDLDIEKYMIEKVNQELNNKINYCRILDNTVEYYYDIDNDKKYIIIDTKFEESNLTRSKSYINYDTSMYEI